MVILILSLSCWIPSFSQSANTTLQNGNWSNAAIWSKGTIPAATDSVIINHYVVMDLNVTLTLPGTLYISLSGSLCSDYTFIGSFVNYGPFKIRYLGITDSSYSYAHFIITQGVAVSSTTGFWRIYYPGYGCVGCTFVCDPVVQPIANFSSDTKRELLLGRNVITKESATEAISPYALSCKNGVCTPYALSCKNDVCTREVALRGL